MLATMKNKNQFTLADFIDKGLLNHTTQIDIGEVEIGKWFSVEDKYLVVKTNKNIFYRFNIENEIDCEKNFIIATDICGINKELYFRKQLTINPLDYI